MAHHQRHDLFSVKVYKLCVIMYLLIFVLVCVHVYTDLCLCIGFKGIKVAARISVNTRLITLLLFFIIMKSSACIWAFDVMSYDFYDFILMRQKAHCNRVVLLMLSL